MEQKARWYKLKVKARLESLTTISNFITEVLFKLGIEQSRDVFEIQLAVDEACTNIIKHAYSKVGVGVISISCGYPDSHDEFVVKIRDYGRPFDPRAVPAPDTKTELNKRKEGGLGIFLMKKIMDRVEYSFSNESNELTMVKHLNKSHTSEPHNK